MIKTIKNNLFTFLIILAYGILLIYNKEIALSAIQNSTYYIKEMIMIMPVIFVLTALLDSWIDKETIIKTLGKNSKTKGTLLSFVLGSISAGPIYAAFPICIMLHKKGASIKNIVIILSSWAVIKVPMLINEVKFLGLTFMIIRWILTIIAIIIFSSLMNKMIKDSDIPVNEELKENKVTINKKACIGCGICTKQYPKAFYLKNKKAEYNILIEYDNTKLTEAIKNCPTKAISH